MIERLLQAQAALDKGMLDVAGRLFDQVAQADPRNAIALVGLARIALREDRHDDARALAEQALAIDPDEAAAQRLLREVHGEVAAAERIPEMERPAEAAAALAAAERRFREVEAAQPASEAPIPPTSGTMTAPVPEPASPTQPTSQPTTQPASPPSAPTTTAAATAPPAPQTPPAATAPAAALTPPTAEPRPAAEPQPAAEPGPKPSLLARIRRWLFGPRG